MDAITDLYTLQLADGLATEAAGRKVVYRTARLRETDTNDERAATRLAERVVMVGGQPKLMASDTEFKLALTMKHIASLEADAANKLDGAVLDLDLFGRLSSHDVGLLEQRIFLITLAAQVRYGLITQAEFDQTLGGQPQAPATPQPLGQAAVSGAPAPAVEPGPALLTDFAGSHAGAAAHGDGR